MRPVLGLPVLLLCAAVCARSGASARVECRIESRDSVYVSAVPVYPGCAVQRQARVLRDPMPAGFEPRGSQTCLAAHFVFVVSEDGAPEGPTIRVERSNDPVFAQALMSVIPTWQYSPALLNGRPVRQIVRVQRRVAIITRSSTSLPGQRPRASSFEC